MSFYGSEKNWETVRQFALEAALTRTDAVIQPRQSNTWGALSLDHVYEFMGGMNLAVRNVTGKDPDAYLSDYRNRNNARMQEVKEAIGIESRTTIFNPAYIKEKMKGEAGAANTFAEIVQNTYGWNVMKPQAVDKEMWNEIYDVYVKDKFNLGVQGYFEKQNPAALEEMTAVMMETIRKGMWQASEQQIADIAKLHTDLVNKYKPSCSGFVCDNAKLRQFIASKMDAQTASRYKENISQIREVAASKEQKGMVMKKEEMNTVGTEQQTNTVSNTVVCVVVVAAVLVLIVLVRCRRKKMQEYLPSEAYKAVINAIEKGTPINREMADMIANGMKNWAKTFNVTHYTHWFQPLTDGTAEKHDGFIEFGDDGNVIERFSGKLLIQQEPDASSFPNGGIRNTFEARGYTAWDVSSPAFIVDSTLCIPTIFISYTGEALDYKTPLLKALGAVDKAATEVCRMFDPNVKRVFANLGWEQEYFLGGYRTI